MMAKTKKEKKNKKKMKKGSRLLSAFFGIGFLIGFGILIYPTVSEIWNAYRSQQLYSDYTEAVQELESEDYSQIWAEAREYNEQHTVNTIVDAFDEEENEYVLTHPYDELLDPLGNGIMGYLEIPKINVELAIYHGASAEVLEKGVGHLEGTSLPIGGEGTHAVLSAHRGLSSAKLFTDLDQLEIGDVFYLTILDETLAYEVDQILTVEPDETEALAIEEDMDLVTLVTCTPYGVNTHRLLVRGHRTEYVEEEIESTSSVITIRNPLEGTDQRQKLLVIAIVAFMIFISVLNVVLSIRDRRRKRRNSRIEPPEPEEKESKP
ncbi:MAG: class C sortase [Lachnospiraceae bacterium]|nr:class C sortase [Lachnospiraceae bacterium]